MLVLHRAEIDTPVGPMLAVASSEALMVLEFGNRERFTRLEARLARWFPPHEITENLKNVDVSRVIDRVREWLEGYFSGTDADASGLPLDMRGAPFEQRVWAALREIPAGTTTTYGGIARRLGDARASRAVGAANGANPIAIIVPCHRVIGADGSLTGYGGGLERKTWLLDHERRWRRDALF
jgi:O-6-methylguanine DNA methyltransferase